MRRIALAVGLAIGAAAQAAQAGGQAVACDDGGTLELPSRTSGEDVLTLYDKVHEFLWQHWRTRSCAIIAVSLSTIEGGSTTAVYRVDRNACGIWVILVSEHQLIVDGPHRTFRSALGEYTKIEREWRPFSGTGQQHSVLIFNDPLKGTRLER
ncbi:MAG: hypothetical protein KBD01_14220 [Acidobacteria bacterium]|nr:hypothetical protein [Acidobacteriota bacterium]